MVLNIKTTDQFPTRVGGLKKAVTIDLAGVTLAATLSLVAVGTAARASRRSVAAFRWTDADPPNPTL